MVEVNPFVLGPTGSSPVQVSITVSAPKLPGAEGVAVINTVLAPQLRADQSRRLHQCFGSLDIPFTRVSRGNPRLWKIMKKIKGGITWTFAIVVILHTYFAANAAFKDVPEPP